MEQTREQRKSSARSALVVGKLGLTPLGGANTEYMTEDTAPKCDPVSYTLQNLKDDIKQPENKAKFKPILLSFSGLSDRRSERIKAAQHLVASESLKQEAKDVTAKSRSTHHFTTEMHFEPVVLSAFKEVFLSKKIEPCFDDASTTEICEFGQRDPVDEHFRFIYRYLSNQLKYSGSKSDHNDEKPKSEILTKSSYNEETSVVNIWDLAIDRIIRHFLAAIQGHLYNHHMWLFIDLKEDLDNLDKPPENSDLMSWRPRLHYLLRSCKLSEDKEKERRKVCTLFAEYNGSIKTEELHKRVKILEDKVQSVAKHIGVSALLEEKIEAINFEGDDNSHRLLYKMLQHTINQTPHKEIPISWVFLRSLFYHLDQDIITRVDLQKMAKSCGIDADLNEFCKFYTSFGSIFDLSLVDPNYQFVILKPINFLKSLESLIFHPADTTTKYGIVPEDKCRKLFDGYMDHFMSALVSLGLAARITRLQLELSADEFADNEDFYYVPIIRSENVREVDQRAVHVLTSIDTPHIFKQVTVTKHLLRLLPRAKLVLSEYRNQTIIKDHSSDTTITLVSHSPATRLQLSKPDEHVCSCIVQAYEKIAEKARSQGITVEYKFVKICVESRLSDVQSIPSCHYHILPDDNLCTKCNETRRTEDVKPTLLDVWNKSLTEHPIKDYFKSTGDLEVLEIAEIAKKITSLPANNVAVIAEAFDCSDLDSVKGGYANDFTVMDIIFSWYKRSKSIQEPRRVFARKISKLGDQLSKYCKSEDQQKEVKAAYTRMAKDVDIYFDPSATN